MRLIMPPRDNWFHPDRKPDCPAFPFTSHDLGFFEYFLNTAIDAGVNVTYDENLHVVLPQVMPFQLDGVKCLYAGVDYPVAPALAWSHEYRCTFMRQMTPNLKPFKNLGSFPEQSFMDWDEYRSLAEIAYRGDSDLILHCQNCPAGHLREKARRMLVTSDCNLGTTMLSQRNFWELAQTCRASVHISGSAPHVLDRGHLQLLGLGVCTISPDIHSCLGDVRPEPGIHFVCVRDDISNLLEKVDWCLNHQTECVEIGNNAKQLFKERCTPTAIWDYVKKRSLNSA